MVLAWAGYFSAGAIGSGALDVLLQPLPARERGVGRWSNLLTKVTIRRSAVLAHWWMQLVPTLTPSDNGGMDLCFRYGRRDRFRSVGCGLHPSFTASHGLPFAPIGDQLAAAMMAVSPASF